MLGYLKHMLLSNLIKNFPNYFSKPFMINI